MMKLGKIEFDEKEIEYKKTTLFINDNEDLITREEYVVNSNEYGMLFIKVDYMNRIQQVGTFIEYPDGKIEKTGTFAKVHQDCEEMNM